MYEFTNKRLNLQLFGEGGDGGAGASPAGGEGAGATTVGSAADDGQQVLRALGVPEELLRKRAKKQTAKSGNASGIATPAQAAPTQNLDQQDAAASTEPTEEPAKLSFAERLQNDPELKEEADKYARDLIQKRIKEENSASKALENLTPLLQYLADSMGKDLEKLSVTELTEAVKNDFLTKESLRMGTSRETAEELIEKRHGDKRAEMQRKAEEQFAQQRSEEQARTAHFSELIRQGEEVKKVFPNFDLGKETENPLFVALTQPHMLQIGMTVEKAYRQVHQQELEALQSQTIARQTTRQVTNAIRAGQNRPVENGVSGRAASVTSFDYKHASKQQREAFKKEIFDAAARGEKIYPGQYQPR